MRPVKFMSGNSAPDEARGKDDDEFERGQRPGWADSTQPDVDPKRQEDERDHQRHGHVTEDHLVDVNHVKPVDGPRVDGDDEEEADGHAPDSYAVDSGRCRSHV